MWKPISQTPNSKNIGDFAITPLSKAEQVIYWAIVLTPVWWLLGIQTLFYPAVVIILLLLNFEIDKLTRIPLPACVWAWLIMSLVMLWTAAIGLTNIGFDLRLVGATLVTLFKSYFFIFACLTLPFWERIRVQVITRAVAWMTSGYLVAIAIQMVMLVLRIGQEGYLPILARLIPSNESSLRIVFADLQPFFGIPLPRTVLYTPDPPILGICSVLCFCICLGETDRRLRKFALAGCIAALLISFSRISWICFPLALIIISSFNSNKIRQSFLWLSSLTCLVCGILGLTLTELINKPLEIFNSARAESSTDREFVITKTIEAWQESPWIGWGIINQTVKWHIYELPLGAFSTYVSVLYLHGITGLFVFILTLFLSLKYCFNAAILGNSLCIRAFAGFVAMCLMLHANPLSWLAVFIWYFFIWLGAVLAEKQQQTKSLSTWKQLCG